MLIGLSLSGLTATAKDKILMNPITKLDASIKTTKISTPEGTYRIFTYQRSYGCSIAVVKIK